MDFNLTILIYCLKLYGEQHNLNYYFKNFILNFRIFVLLIMF